MWTFLCIKYFSTTAIMPPVEVSYYVYLTIGGDEEEEEETDEDA